MPIIQISRCVCVSVYHHYTHFTDPHIEQTEAQREVTAITQLVSSKSRSRSHTLSHCLIPAEFNTESDWDILSSIINS